MLNRIFGNIQLCSKLCKEQSIAEMTIFDRDVNAEIPTILTGLPKNSGVFSLNFSRSSLTFAAKLELKQRRSNGASFKQTKMPLTKDKKASIFANIAGDEKNTGSIEGQIALLTERIAQISAHLNENKKDFSTHRGLMQLVGKRRRLLNYLQRHNLQSYRSLIEKLGIRK